MNELMGTLRPVKQRINTAGPTHHYDVDTIGDVGTSLRYREDDELGIIEILDEARVPYADGADGFALYDQSGVLLSWWQLFMPNPGEELRLSPGWGFRASRSADETRLADAAEVGAR